MGGEGQSIFLWIVVIAVAFIVAAWLIHLIFRIRKTQKVYRSIMEKKKEESRENETERTVPEEDPDHNHTEGEKQS